MVVEERTICEGNYSVIEQLGRGGQGSVCRVRRNDDGREFACKTTRAELSEFAIEEAEKMKRLKGCRGVLQLEEFIRDGDTGAHHMITELCSSSLLKRIYKASGISEQEAAYIIGALALILQQVHSRGILHRDLKPGNILLIPSSRFKPKPYFEVRLSDFGLAADSGEHGDFVGTLYYQAPESFLGEYSEATDVYGLGMILYEMLAGEKPFDWRHPTMEYMKVSAENKRDLTRTMWLKWAAKISPKAKEFILKLTCFEVNERLTTQQILEHTWIVDNLADYFRK